MPRKGKGDGKTAPRTRSNKEYRAKRAKEVKQYGRRKVEQIERRVRAGYKRTNRIKKK